MAFISTIYTLAESNIIRFVIGQEKKKLWIVEGKDGPKENSKAIFVFVLKMSQIILLGAKMTRCKPIYIFMVRKEKT